jgi:hypothetical protein
MIELNVEIIRSLLIGKAGFPTGTDSKWACIPVQTNL